jgi:hypothetical protein
VKQQSLLWEIPRLWADETVFILGGGPSIKEVDFELIRNHRVIAVNHAVSLGPWVDVVWFGDKNWGVENRDLLLSFGGLKVTCSTESQVHRRIPSVKYVARSKSYGIEYNKRTHIAWNGNSGASAVNLAYWLGASTVVLLGFEMKIVEVDGKQKTHWHDKYQEKRDKKKQLVNPYPRFMKGWLPIFDDANKIGLKIINCTPDSDLTMFPYKPLEKLCQEIFPLQLT